MKCDEALHVIADNLLGLRQEAGWKLPAAENHLALCDECSRDLKSFADVVGQLVPQVFEGAEGDVEDCDSTEQLLRHPDKQPSGPLDQVIDHLVVCRRCSGVLAERLAEDTAVVASDVSVETDLEQVLGNIKEKAGRRLIEDEVRDRIERDYRLPEAVQRLLDLLEDIDAPVREIERCFEHDPFLTTRLLKVANSAYYGCTGKIGDIPKALVLLGFHNVRMLVLTFSLMKTVQDLEGPLDGHGVERDDFVTQSVFTAACASSVWGRFGEQLDGDTEYSPDKLFTAGLLRDIGMVVLSEFLRDHAEQVTADIAAGRSLVEIEREHLGLDHAQVGGMILERFRLPSFLVQAVVHHHDPEALPANPAARILACCDALIAEAGEKDRRAAPPETFPLERVPDPAAVLGVDADELAAFTDGLGETLRGAVSDLN